MSETRKVKVNYRSSHEKYVPALILQGKCLEQYGFSTDTYISVECEEGKLTITLREPDAEERKKSIEDRISLMSKAQRKQISAFLDELEK